MFIQRAFFLMPWISNEKRFRSVYLSKEVGMFVPVQQITNHCERLLVLIRFDRYAPVLPHYHAHAHIHFHRMIYPICIPIRIICCLLLRRRRIAEAKHITRIEFGFNTLAARHIVIRSPERQFRSILSFFCDQRYSPAQLNQCIVLDCIVLTTARFINLLIRIQISIFVWWNQLAAVNTSNCIINHRYR